MISSGTFPEIARWWRRERNAAGRTPRAAPQGDDRGDGRMPLSTDPRTLLLRVTRSQDGLTFIRGRVRSLRKQLRVDDDPQSRFLLALYLEKMGEDHLEEALAEMDSALARMLGRSGGNSESGWAKSERSRLAKAVDSLLVRRHALLEARDSRATAVSSPAGHESGGIGASVHVGGDSTPISSSGRKRPRPGGSPEDSGLSGSEGSPLPRVPLPRGPACMRFQAIDERTASTLSYEDFIETYALRGRPVVLKGGASLCFEEGNAWSREALRVEAGHKVVPVRRWVPDSVSWARLEKAGQMPLERLLSQPAKATTSGQACAAGKGLRDTAACGQIEMDGGDPLYLHDWSLPQNLGLESPLLAGKFRVPKFFAGDLLQRLAGRGLPYTDSWPSLFIGPKGSRSDTHIDSFGSHFWMALLEGKKRWLLYPKEEAPLLYPIWPEGCHDPVFEADLDNPNATRTPATLEAKGFSCVLEAGVHGPSSCRAGICSGQLQPKVGPSAGGSTVDDAQEMATRRRGC
ncbi:unnamed protein product [Ectocarpus fasciculatus]